PLAARAASRRNSKSHTEESQEQRFFPESQNPWDWFVPPQGHDRKCEKNARRTSSLWAGVLPWKSKRRGQAA
ncbi:MAG: hypothetical protein NC548_08220, partial [Lachnospiraceae bacterium]|nr:hypothetical protein [Lachnospiraceae bacterium]